MKTKTIIFALSLLLVGVLLTACGGETPAPVEPSQPEAAPAEEVPTEAPAEAADAPQDVPLSEITNITWQWVELVETMPAAQSVVPTPEKYTVAFFDDGTFTYTADCKSGSGNYTAEGNRITFEPFPVTMQICSEESLEPQFLGYLTQVTFGMREGKLVFVLPEGAGEMRFQNGGPAEMPVEPVEMTIFVGPEKVTCGGVGVQECYQVSDSPDGEWQPLYGEIEGFQWAPGYIYELRVNAYEIPNPPADAPSMRYELIEVVSQTPVEVENVTGIDPATVAIDTFDLPYAYQPNLVLETPYDNSGAQPTGLPQHIQINFGVVSPAEVQPGDPIFYIIPVAAYKELWQNAGDPGVEDTLGLLQLALTEQPMPVPAEGMPVLPNERVPAYNDLAVQGKYLNFNRGYGVRFVGRFSQDPAPVTNEGLFYIFQGFSYDGNYFYAFFYPVTTTALPATAADVPEDEMTRFQQDSAAYMAERVQMLNGLAPADWDANLETLDALVSSLSYVSVYDQPAEAPEEVNPLVNITWQWTAFSDPAAGESAIPDPENYVLFFNEDGTFNLIADCNTGNGTYTTYGSLITLSIGQITRMACEEGSRSDQFVAYLGNVVTYVFDENGRLVLNIVADSGNLFFTGGAPIEPPAPGEGVPMATALEPINVWAGPGKEYGSYGTAPIGATAEIIGKSADGKYWVIQISTEIAPDGRGWVLATYVQAENADGVPVIEAP